MAVRTRSRYGISLADRPGRPVADLDDWFAESDPEPARTGDTTVRAAVVPAETSAPVDEDWLSGDDASRGRRPVRPLADVLREWKVVAATGALAVLLLVGLWVGGVFSSNRAATPPTHPATTHRRTTTTTAKTSTKTTPAKSAATVGPTTTLKPGDSGQEVTALQNALRTLGYLTGTADGVYGPATQAAVTAFQTASNLTTDGVLGPATLAALTSALAGP